MNQKNEAIHLILTGIRDEIYSTVDACITAQEIWEAIKRNKGKEIAKPITPPSELASKEDSDPEQAQRDKDMQENLALIAKYFKKIYKHTNNSLRTSLNSRNKNVDTSPRKPKRVKDSAYHKEKMLLCKQVEQGVLLQAEQYDWLANTNEEVDEQELEAHYSYMAKIQEVPNADSGTDSEPVEQNDNQSGKFRSQRTVNVAGLGRMNAESQRVKDSTYHKEKMLLCKQAEKGVPLQAEQSDWLANTNEEIDE
nr:hypothetical protein [Tanacetum cinerariifolium]